MSAPPASTLRGRLFIEKLGAEAEIFYCENTAVVELVEKDTHHYVFDQRSVMVNLAKQERPSTAQNFPSKRRAVAQTQAHTDTAILSPN